MTDLTKILRIDSSARRAGSTTRKLTDALIDQLASRGSVQITTRDVSSGLPFVDEEWVSANFTPADTRSQDQKAKLAFSDALVAEIDAVDTLIIGLPIYNFGVPATLKAWIDMVARAGLSFKYTDKGPIGLLSGKRAILLVASGGTQVGSSIDFATPYLRHALGFIGIQDVTFIAADALGRDAEAKINKAIQSIETLAA